MKISARLALAAPLSPPLPSVPAHLEKEPGKPSRRCILEEFGLEDLALRIPVVWSLQD